MSRPLSVAGCCPWSLRAQVRLLCLTPGLPLPPTTVGGREAQNIYQWGYFLDSFRQVGGKNQVTSGRQLRQPPPLSSSVVLPSFMGPKPGSPADLDLGLLCEGLDVDAGSAALGITPKHWPPYGSVRGRAGGGV